MRSFKWLLAAVPLVVVSPAFAPPNAAACGACFHGEGENTQVTGHRMVFSISQSQTTLWDQISYTGNPASFAWVLPVKGTVEIGVSSDLLFEALDQDTQVTVNPPTIDCPAPPPDCYGYGGEGGAGGADGAGGGGVTVVAEAVVGPYETVTLHSADPNALSDWLTSHGYVIQPDFAPVVAAYIQEGFDFVAVKLVPGMGITAMKPVRVTTPGAGAALPLRMVAAGAGVLMPVTLWILGEGRYEPQNFPTFTISENDLVWDFNTSSSNYSVLRQAGFSAGKGDAWLIETSTAISSFDVSEPIDESIAADPVGSGYGDAQGNGAEMNANDDYVKLWGSIAANALWLTRVSAQLPRAALATDLTLGADAQQSTVDGNLTAAKGINVPPCPVYDGCGGYGGYGGGGGHGVSVSGNGCTVGSASDRSAAFTAALVALGVALLRRRR